jgi:hypothetical protein
MPNIWKPQSREVYASWVNALRDESSERLTSWESDFLDSIEGRLAFHKDLTQRQAEILERIYTEKTK